MVVGVEKILHCKNFSFHLRFLVHSWPHPVIILSRKKP